MTNTIGGATIELGVDSSGVESGLDRVDGAVRRTGRTLDSLRTQGGGALDAIGSGGSAAASRVDAATRNIAGAVERANAALIAGKKSGAEYFEELGRSRGADMLKLAPLIAQLRETEAAQARAKAATDATTASQQAAAEAARAQSASLREVAAAQAGRDSFVASLREQVALYGKSADEILRYKAAQAGAAEAAGPLILQLQNMRAAQEAVAEAARAAAAAQRQADQVQSNRDAMLAGLREQIALYGKTTEEVLRYRAAQAGAAGAAEPLIQELQRQKTAQDAVTESTRLAAAAQQQAAQQQAAGASMVASLREQVALYGKTTEEVLRYKAAQAGVAGAAEPHIQELARLKIAEEGVAAAAKAAAEAQRQAATAQTGRDTFVASLQQQAAAIGKTRSDLLELQAAQMGVTAQAAPFIAKLREVEQGLNHTGMSARATAAAMRGVPAQFTDIIVSLQGGQPVMSVLLQQGGQLKDMFGGLGNAAKALGGYVLGLISPITIVSAAAAVLAVAFVQGKNESIAYSRALITTGNAAGTTAGQLSDMARNISATVGTQGAAAEAIAALAGTGKVAAGNLQEFGLVAIQVQRALGKSVQDTVGDFADLGKAPSATLLKLNEEYRFLTGEVYSQVKALEMQGRTIEAATVAQEAYASAASSVSSKVADNLGTLQKAWKGITDVAKGAWDAMLNVGRQDSLEDKLSKTQAAIEKARKPFEASIGGNSEARSQLAANVVLERLLQGQIKLKNEEANAERESNKLREAGLEWDKEKEKYLTRVQLREQEITKARNQAAAAGVSQADTDTRLAAIKLKYADTYNLAIDAQIELLKRRGVVEEESAKRSMSSLAADRAAGLATSLLAEFKYAEEVAKLDQEALARKRALLVAELALTAAKPNSKKEQAGLNGAIAEVDAQALTRTMQLKEDLRVLDIKDTKQGLANLADLAAARATDSQALQSQLQAQKDANAVIGLSAVEVNKFNMSLAEEAATRKEVDAGILDTIIGRESEAAALRASADAMRKLGAETALGVSLSSGTDVAKAKELLDILVAVDNAAKQAAQGMTESFGRVGSAIGGLTTALSGYAVQQQAIAAQLAAIKADPKSGADKIAQAELAATKASATAKVKSYADMASAAKGFFNENSKGYKALETTEKAFRAYEMAMAVESMVKKIFFKEAEVSANLALNATKLTGEAATTGASVALAGTEASAWGVTAVVKALASLPFPLNLAAGAATLAAVVAIGAKMVGGVGGGGADVSKQRQEAAGTGSILGDSSAKSDSISRSIELAATNSSIELTHTAGMLASLKAIENSIGGLANLLVRGSGLTGEVAGDVNGAAQQTFDKVFGPGSLGEKLTGGLVGKVVGSIFGGKVTTLDTGLTANAASLGSIAAGGLNAQQYTDIKKSGGLFSSSKTSTQTSDLGAQANDQFAKVILNLSQSVKTAADLLGVGGDAFTAKLNTFVVDIGKISLKGLTGTEIQEALETVFSKLGDDMAQFGVAGLESFQKVGEGYFETLTRVAVNYANLNSIMESIGTTFGATGMSSIAARERLIELAGGIDELASQTASFADNFLTEAERLAPVQKYVTDQLATMGLQSLDTRDKFKDYVLGLANSGKLATESGAQQYASLLALSEAFAKTHAATVDLTKSEQGIADERKDLQDKLDELTMTQEQLAKKARDAIDGHNLALYDQVIAAQAAKDATEAASEASAKASQDLLTAVNTAFNGVTASVNAQKKLLESAHKASMEAMQAQTDKTGASVTKLKSLSDALGGALSSIRGQSVSELDDRQSGQAQIASALAIARASGTLPSADSLKDALAAVSKDASDQFASFTDYQRSNYQTAMLVSDLSDLTGSQLSVEQRMLDSLNAQKDLAAQAYQEEVTRLDGILETAKLQIDLLNGINVGIASIPAALAALAAALGKAQADPATGSSAVTALFQNLLGRAPKDSGLDFWTGALGAGTSTLADIQKQILASEEYKKLHPFAVGTNYVPGDMPALIHEGERIIPAADNRELISRLRSPSSDGNGDLLAELREQRRENAEMRAMLESHLYAIAKSARNTEDFLDGAVNGNTPITTKDVTTEETA